jgi:hypothetical protein
MDYYIEIKPEDVRPQDAQKVLDFLNDATSPKEIMDAVDAVEIPTMSDVGWWTAKYILAKRDELGRFTDLQQVADVYQVGPRRFAAIIVALSGSTYGPPRVLVFPEDVSPEDAQKVLDFLNDATSPKEIADAVEIPYERDVGEGVAQCIYAKRDELGRFTDLQQVADVHLVGPERFTEIIVTLSGSTYGAPPVLVVTIGGYLYTDIHGVVEGCLDELDYDLNDENWYQQETAEDIVAGTEDAWSLLGNIKYHTKVVGQSLLIVGKSAGGVVAWQTLRLYWESLSIYRKVALVLVDPHGSAEDDGYAGPYYQYQDLWWPDCWSKNKNFFRVYHIFQQNDSPTGAAFPSSHVAESVNATDSLFEVGVGTLVQVTHKNIPSHTSTKWLIGSAFEFCRE